MAIDITAVMRKAADLTRAHKLLDATRVIQDALSGGATPSRPPYQSGGPAAADRPPTLDFKAEGAAPGGEEPASGQASPFPGAQARFGGLAGARGTRPLAEVVQALRRGKLEFPAPLARPRAKTGTAPAHPAGAEFLTRSFSNAAGTRSYKLYVPARPLREPRALIVMLHGCTQDPDDFAAGTGMNALAEEHGFLVAYPAQPKAANQMGCWNWFDPKDQGRGGGEPSIIAGLTREIVAEFSVDPTRVFVAGLSAGGAMAAIMGETYPDLYSAIGIHSGLAYGSAGDMPGAFAAMRGEEGLPAALRRAGRTSAKRALPVRTIVIHGAADQTVHPSNADRIVAALAHGAKPGVRETVTGVTNGRAYSRTLIEDLAGRPLAEHWVVEGASHAWSGGDPAGSYTDPQGPDASREMVRFFMEMPATMAAARRSA